MVWWINIKEFRWAGDMELEDDQNFTEIRLL